MNIITLLLVKDGVFLFMMRQYMCSCFIACNAYLFKLFRFDKIMMHFAFLRNLHVYILFRRSSVKQPRRK
jgi:hypothetical protein